VKGLRSTLVLRVFIIFMIILVIPLFVNTLVIYFHEYQARRVEVFLSLTLLADEERASLDQATRFMQREAIWINQLATEGNANHVLQTFVSQGNYKSAFFLSGSDGICRASSDQQMVGQNFPELFDLGKGDFVLRLTKMGVLFSQGVRDETINLLLTNEGLLQLLGKRTSFALPYDSSIVSDKGIIVASSDASLKGMDLPVLQRKEGLVFLHEGKQRYAVEVSFPYTNFTLLLDVPTTAAYFALWSHLGRMIGIFAIAVFIGAIIVTWAIFRMARPLSDLCLVMGDVEKGDMSARYQNDRFGFELNRVGVIFNEMIASLLRKAKEVEEERFHREALSKELIMGGDIQRDIIPRHIEGFDELDIATAFIPAMEIGGDYYDLYPIGDKLLIVVADGSGKGIYAGFFSLTLRGIIRGMASEDLELSELIARANDLFCLDTKESGVFVTAWFGLYDKRSRMMTYACCGHLPTLLRRADGKIEELGTNGMALGVCDVREVVTECVQLEEGDLLVGYTDGITEAHNEQQELFGKEPLLKVVSEKYTPEAVTQAVLQAVQEFETGVARFDDQTIVAIQLTFLE
jgi:serine phosphatase RsbU (regulator of sigma subunit)